MKQAGGAAPILGRILASEPAPPPRQKSAVDHGVYSAAHASYSKMTAADLQAHSTALRHVRDGKAAATKEQLSGDVGY